MTAYPDRALLSKTTPPAVATALAFAALLFIPLGSSAQAQTAVAEPSLPYTVKASDKLIRLSRDLLVRPAAWAEVAKFNQLKDPNFIKPGQKINIPLRLLKFQPAAGRVISIAGDVRLGGAPVAVGAQVPEGSRLQTAANSSAVVELGDGTQVKLLPNTLADVVGNRDYAMRDASASGSTTWFSGLVRLAQGVLETLATRTQNRATPLQIETPTSLVGVRGTQFRVGYEDPASRNARTEVIEGQVRADNPAQASGADLPKGTGAVVNPAQREVRVVTLLAAPDLSASPAEVNKPQGQWPLPTLAGATAFRVQVASDEKFDQIVRDLKVSTASVDLSSLDNARWYTRVRGIDAQGLEGFDSVRIITIKEPPPPPPPAPPIRWRITTSSLSATGGQNLLTWGAQRTDGQPLAVTAYSVEIASNGAFTEGVVRLQAAEPKVALGELKAGNIYYVRLRATLADGKVVEGGEYRIDLPGNWGATVFDAGFPLVPLASR